jgi:hypothetical protein
LCDDSSIKAVGTIANCSDVKVGGDSLFFNVLVDAESKRLKNPKTVDEEEMDNWPKKATDQLARLVTQVEMPEKVMLQSLRGRGLAKVYRRILQNRIRETLRLRSLGCPPSESWDMQQIMNFRYADGAEMITLGWLIYRKDDEESLSKCKFKCSPYFKEGDDPLEVITPNLTFREMRALDQFLPDRIDDSDEVPVKLELKKLYAEVYRLFPAFAETDF